ncbi:MAG: TIGR00296 family protein [Candidatus Aenigmatarchaeota archaeon]
MFNLKQGKELIKLARKAVEKRKVGMKFSKEFEIKKGVFVTIETYPEKELRGCIGFPYPIFSLGEAVQKAAISAAYEDPRFKPMEKEELGRVIFEVSILTEPEIIRVKRPKEYFEKIEIGRDGLIIQYGFSQGLLLPQVPVEYKWNVEDFLNNLCYKAGLPPTMWKNLDVKIYKFESQIFMEKSPLGDVVERKLSAANNL